MSAAPQFPISSLDPNSYGNLDETRLRHFHLALTADFKAQTLAGSVTLDIESLKDGVTRVVLDTNHLEIASATDEQGNPLATEFGAEHEAFGKPLAIALPASAATKGARTKVTVAYSTTPSASAVQWLPPSQTLGKEHPYLFTQCQAIHARSVLPIQDAPSSKCPYSAEITVPAPLVALMSAVSEGEPVQSGELITYKFVQKVPIPSYLVAIAIGNLEKRDIGPRTAVWCEAEMVDAAAFEFADTEKYLTAAEEIAGPYVWGRYDILVMPPSFPYGGMENPCLTFATPTLLAGDRSLANVIAHEAAHSWFGNHVSTKNWCSFWANEGFTVFLERKLVRAVHGEKDMHLHAIIGWKALQDSVDRYGHDHPYTALVPNLDGVDPDDAFSSVPYEKGFNFLFYLQGLVGGPDAMNPFLRAYCDKFGYGNVDSNEIKAFFLAYFQDKVDAQVLAGIDWDTWYYKPGMPPIEPKFDTSLADAAIALAENLAKGDATPASGDLDGWSSNQIVVFLERLQLLQRDALAAAGDDKSAVEARFATLLTNMAAAYGLLDTKNAEIRSRFLELSILAQKTDVYQHVVDFITSQGRMKFVRPIFRKLFSVPSGRDLAVSTFNEHRTIYHSIAQKMLAKDLQVA